MLTTIIEICALWFLSGLLVGGVVADRIAKVRAREELIERRLGIVR